MVIARDWRQRERGVVHKHRIAVFKMQMLEIFFTTIQIYLTLLNGNT